MFQLNSDLQAELSSSPVSSLGVVSDSVTSSHSDPLGNRAVLLDLLSQDSLELETLDSSLRKDIERVKQTSIRIRAIHSKE